MNDPDLVVLFADVDAQRFVSKLLDRGVERRCLRPLNWVPVRDPMKDARLSQDPLVVARPYIGHVEVRFLVLWDHHGSGRDRDDPKHVEADVVRAFERAGVGRERVAAVSFVPELEAVFEPVWDRVLAEFAAKRRETATTLAFDSSDPKAAMEAVAKVHRLRIDPQLFSDLGGLSINRLKLGDALRRISERLVDWFGTTE